MSVFIQDRKRLYICKNFRSLRLVYPIHQRWYLFGLKSDRAPCHLHCSRVFCGLHDTICRAGRYPGDTGFIGSDYLSGNGIISPRPRESSRDDDQGIPPEILFDHVIDIRIGLEPVVTGFDAGNATFTWKTSYGWFLSWNAPDFRVNELGGSATNHGEKLYWSFIDRPASTAIPVEITVTATDPASGRILGSSTATLAWEDNYSVIVRDGD